VPAEVDIPEEPASAGLYRAAERFPYRVATDFMGATTTYRALLKQVEKAAEALRRLGVVAGDRVAIVLPNCTQHVVAFYAVLRLGAVVVEHNPTYQVDELVHQLSDSGATVAICWEKAVRAVEQARPRTVLRDVIAVDLSRDLPLVKRFLLRLPIRKARATRATMRGPIPAGMPRWERIVAAAPRLDAAHPAPAATDLALLQYTGGTTGVPKGAMLTHRNVVANAIQDVAWTQLSDGTETLAGALPFFHAFGINVCLVYGIRIASTLVLFPKFDADAVLHAQRRRPVTVFPGVPPMFERVAVAAERHGADLSSIRFGISGAMALSPETARRWEALTGGLVIEGYGLTECSPLALGNPLSPARQPGTLGLPYPSTTIRVVDPEDPTVDVRPGERGELLVRGPQVFAGYWQRPKDTAAALLPDGWLRTGDIVEVDDQTGFTRLVDRIKEVIIIGGFNVYPSQVEDRVREMPGVEDVAVVGMPSGDLGEKVVAAVVMAAGATRLELEAVREWCGERLARYAIPRELVFLHELPRSQIGKVMRRVVREQLLTHAPGKSPA
jgi:long-chain acyl-CoA synthetase